jgi:uncharacterized membrane protein YraQ (UPF0718 family)
MGSKRVASRFSSGGFALDSISYLLARPVIDSQVVSLTAMLLSFGEDFVLRAAAGLPVATLWTYIGAAEMESLVLTIAGCSRVLSCHQISSCLNFRKDPECLRNKPEWLSGFESGCSAVNRGDARKGATLIRSER